MHGEKQGLVPPMHTDPGDILHANLERRVLSRMFNQDVAHLACVIHKRQRPRLSRQPLALCMRVNEGVTE